METVLQKHFENNCLAASYLVIDPDIKKLNEIAIWFSSHFNTADVFRLCEKEGTKSIHVAETLEFTERAQLSPIGDRKLFIICDIANMTVQAQNKMLKTIEDAPAKTIFFLLSTAAEPVLNTIKSRCITVYPAPKNYALRSISAADSGVHAAPRSTNTADSGAHATPRSANITDSGVHTAPQTPDTSDLGTFTTPFFESPLPQEYSAYLDQIKPLFKDLSLPRDPTNIYEVLKTLARINRNISANCNPQNQADLLAIRLICNNNI
jgi:hypothetical protein